MRRVLLAGLVLVGVAMPAGATCLKSNTAGQIAEGRLTIGKAKDAAGRPESPYILRLSVSACLDGPEPDDRVKNTSTIHVYSGDEKIQADLRRFVGKTVLVRGNPFPQHTAHHHAPIVMDVTEINAH